MNETLPTLRFHETDFEIVDHNGEKWVTVKALADALGYADHRKLINLINRRPDEFGRKTTILKLRTVEGNVEKLRDVTVISYHGIIRAAMLSDAPRAKEFRDYAEDVLFKVMVLNQDPRPAASIDGTLSRVLAGLNANMQQTTATLSLLTSLVEDQRKRLDRIEESGGNWALYPPDKWQTAGDWARRNVKDRLPVRFNMGGHWETFVASQHRQHFGKLPAERRPATAGRTAASEYVYPRTIDMNSWMWPLYKAWVAQYHPHNQQRLKLVIGGGAR